MDANGVALSVPQHTPFGPDIDNVSHVCERIERAQIAILHPERDPSDFVGATFFERTGGGFSFDSILIDISGPDVTDLSFVDLPGTLYFLLKAYTG
jgi:hypothetical protein